jgi:DNA-binding XRE family transcriptional regulator
MGLPFGLSTPQVAVAGVAVAAGAVKLFGPKLLEWWYRSNQDQRKRIREWHREMQEHLSNIRSVGIRVQTGRKLEVDEVEELIPTAIKMESKVNPEPVAVKSLVDDDVRATVRQSTGLVYHFAHLPQPEEDEDSIAGVMRHQYEILQRIDADTGVTLDEVLEIVGGFERFGGVEISDEEGEKMLEEFEEESLQRIENAEEMTVDELMELRWKIVDKVASAETRQRIVEFAIEQYYEICLLDKPKEAENALEESEEHLFD